MNIYQKLLKIQTEITALKTDKDGNGYKYLTMDKILLFVKPRMNELGLLLKQEVLDFENERMDYKVSIKEIWENGKPTGKFTGKPKSEILTKVKMRMTWVDVESGETDVNLWGANGQNDWEKGFGSALTYGERYFVMKYFHLSTDKDDVDNPNRKIEPIIGKLETSNIPPKTEEKPKGKTTPPTPVVTDTEETAKPVVKLGSITEKQIARIHILIKESGANKTNIYTFFNIKTCKELDTKGADEMITMLTGIKKKQNGKVDATQISQIVALLKKTGYSKKGLLKKYDLKDLDSMLYKDANVILEGLRKLANKN